MCGLDACRQNPDQSPRACSASIARRSPANLRRWGISSPKQSRTLQPGSLVAIEGIDGAGISTQVDRLVGALNASGHQAIATAEPTAGPVGHQIRRVHPQPDLLVDGGLMRTLSLLFAADRVDHFHRVVAPALTRGITVVSDRWYHSSLAYQRTVVDRDWIMSLNRHTRTPDVTVFLAIRPEVGQQRRTGRASELFHAPERQQEVVGGYRATIAELRSAGERIEIVDGEVAIDDVAAGVRDALGVTA